MVNCYVHICTWRRRFLQSSRRINRKLCGLFYAGDRQIHRICINFTEKDLGMFRPGVADRRPGYGDGLCGGRPDCRISFAKFIGYARTGFTAFRMGSMPAMEGIRFHLCTSPRSHACAEALGVADEFHEAQEKCPKFFKQIGHLEMTGLRCFSQKQKYYINVFCKKHILGMAVMEKTVRLNLIQSG